MTSHRALLMVCVLAIGALTGLSGAQTHLINAAAGTEVASLHAGPALAWHQTSPSPQHPDGPVLYQLLFDATGTPGEFTVFGTNPRHLAGSPMVLSNGNVQIGGAGGLTINGTTGIVTFNASQTFPGTTGVNSVTQGNAFITIGGTGANPTVGLNTTGAGGTDARYLQLNGGTMTGNITFAGSQTFPGATLAGEVTGPTSATVVSNAVSADTASAIVRRDASGNFSAGTVTLSGNLALPFTNGTGSTGVVTVGGTPFISSFGLNDVFIGPSAGNTTTTGFYNTAVGGLALHANSAQFNNGFGYGALSKNVLGGNNNAFGSLALFSLVGTNSSIQGNDNSAFGDSALTNTTTGYSNSAFGFGAGANIQSGFNNVTVGWRTMGNQGNPTGAGSGNTAVGDLAMGANLGGSFNTVVGYRAGDGILSSLYNVAVGYQSLFTAQGSNNDAFGYNALVNLGATGNSNTAIGDQALQGLTSGSSNIALGASAGTNLGIGSNNIYIGSPGPASGGASESNTIRIGNAQTQTFIAGTINFASGIALPDTTSAGVPMLTLGGKPYLHDFPGVTSGNLFVGGAGNLTNAGIGGNTGVGVSALVSLTNGFYNSAFGGGALGSNTLGQYNSAFGLDALLNNGAANDNSAFGASALQANTAGTGNSAFGRSALAADTANNNSAFGFHALFANTTGTGNSGFGSGALNSNAIGNRNSAFGFNALAADLGDNTFASDGSDNSAFGYNALTANTSGYQNTAFGSGALSSNVAEFRNSAFGYNAMANNGSGGRDNSAFGDSALSANTGGNGNVAVGSSALVSNTGGFLNTAIGEDVMPKNTSGSRNVAVGDTALEFLVSGSNNIAIGEGGGADLTGSESNNIEIGDIGVVGESNVIRIGSGSGGVNVHTAAFIGGISGATSAAGIAVLVNSSGQLGTTTSSRRFKNDIVSMDKESDVLMKLRPVSFYYKPELDSDHVRQYGLVAEEVAAIAPGLVVFDKDGKPETVRYHFVNAMLLNEVQKQRTLIETQAEQIAQLSTTIKGLQAAQQSELETLREEVKALRGLIEVQQSRTASLARVEGPK